MGDTGQIAEPYQIEEDHALSRGGPGFD
jgi:hypothetical protein